MFRGAAGSRYRRLAREQAGAAVARLSFGELVIGHVADGVQKRVRGMELKKSVSEFIRQ